jgi:hypothetical protein
MAGRPRGSEARDETLKVRVTKAGKDAATRAARPMSVSDYVRGLIAKDIKERGL